MTILYLLVRRLISFFKLPEDFEDERGYNDYLEEVEDIVFRLVNDVDVQSTYARLEAFRLENRDALETAHARQAHEQRQAEAAERATQQQRERIKTLQKAEEAEEEANRSAAKRSLIDELVSRAQLMSPYLVYSLCRLHLMLLQRWYLLKHKRN